MCPLQSIWVTYTRDRCAYVVDLTLPTVESTAFGRQGPEVQILSPRPFILVVSMSCDSRSRLYLAGVPLWHICGTRRNIYGHYQKEKWPLSRPSQKERIPHHYWHLFKADCCQKMDSIDRGGYREEDIHRLLRGWNNNLEWSSWSIWARHTSIKEGQEGWTLPNWYSATISGSLLFIWSFINGDQRLSRYPIDDSLPFFFETGTGDLESDTESCQSGLGNPPTPPLQGIKILVDAFYPP